jgi:hypothetical protein
VKSAMRERRESIKTDGIQRVAKADQIKAIQNNTHKKLLLLHENISEFALRRASNDVP